MTDRYQVIREALPALIAEAQSKGGRNERAALIIELLDDRDELQAEVEALRAEVERLRTDGASAVRWAPSSAYWSEVLRELFGPNARDGIAAIEARLSEGRERTKQLEGALEEIRSRSSMNFAMRPDPFALAVELGNIHQIADAALAQEDRND